MSGGSAPAPFVIALTDPAAADPTRVGPKAAGLARLAPHHPVPPGFCITADAYRYAREAGGLDARLANEICAAFAGLRADDPRAPVAVRSSALDEDGLEASFAGRHETVLGVRDEAGLLDAVARCWASLESDDALAYRREQSLPTTGLALPVLVQRLVPADVAGVAFSAEPVGGRRDRIVITAAWGLGESVVSGTTDPDTWTVAKDDLRSVHERVGGKERLVVVDDDAVRETDTPSWLRERASLSAEQVQEVARTVRSLERRLGRPVDVEFAYEGADLRLLQCRPVTRVPDPPPVPSWVEPEDADRHWKRDLAHFPEPIPALEGDLARRFLEAGHRAAMRTLDAPIDWRLRRFWSRYYEHDGAVVPRGPEYDAALAAAKARVAESIPNLDPLWNDTWRPEIERRTEALRRIAPTDDASAVRALDEIDEHGRRLWAIHFELVIPAGSARSRFAEAYRELFPDHGPLAPWELTRGFDVLTTRAGRDLDRVARAARAAPSVAASLTRRPIDDAWAAIRTDPHADAFRAELDAYLKRHGERAPRLGFTVPTFQEDPTPVLAMLRGRLAGDGEPGEDGEAERRRHEAVRERRTAEAHRTLRGWPSAARDEFRLRLEAARIGTRITEDHNYLIDFRSTAVLRGALLRTAERAVAAGRLARSTDVAHLTLDRFRSAFADGTPLQEEVARAEEAFRNDAAFEPPAELNPPARPQRRPEATEPTEPDDPDLLHGVPASAGRVRGRVRSLRNLDARDPLRSDEVLCVPTAGLGWTPTFAVIRALVTESGGPLSHDAVIAREYGLPAVVGAAGAVGRWPDGTVVEVDGEAGTVRRVAEPDF